MTLAAIQQLDIKPDLKRAMLYAYQLAHQPEITVIETKPIMGTIWHYKGPELWLSQSSRSQICPGSDFLWMEVDNRAFASHNWFDLTTPPNNQLRQFSQLVGKGDQHAYNQLIQQHLQSKFDDNTQSTL